MSAAESVVSQIQHYQKSIQKYHGNSSRILHCINKLYSLPVTVQHLQDTGVGKTINSLRKSDGEVGESARALVYKWKQMVEEESENEQESNVNVRAHSKFNGNTENEDIKVKIEKQSRESSDKTSRSNDTKDHVKSDYNKDYKRKRDSDHDQNRDKRYKSEKIDSIQNFNFMPDENRRSINGHNETFGEEEEWTANRQSRGNSSDDDRDTRHGYIKTEQNSSEECNAQSFDDDMQHQKSSKQEKSYKQKSKSSSSSSERSKLSSSKHEQKESRSSSSSKYKEEKPSPSGSSSHTKKDSSNQSDNKSEDRSKSREKDKKDKHKDKHKSREEKKSSKEKKEKEKMKSDEEDGVDSFSGKSFEAALGMMFPPEKSKKKSSSGTSSSLSPVKKKSKSSSSSSEKKTKDVKNFSYEMERESSPELPPSIGIDEDFGLPALNPNYKPLPQPSSLFNSPPKRYQSEDDALSNIMYSKVQRTKVYSGNKSGYTHVPSLFDLCTRVLQENIDALEYTGGVPFDLLKPVLERATADQLFTLEHYNAYLIEDTDIFWQYHCTKDFRNKKREEMETWREMYLRCRDERESKLKSLTANIAASAKAKLLPVRKTQFVAHIEGTSKRSRKQAKFGTALASTSSAPSKSDGSGLSSSFTGRSTTVLGPGVSVPAQRGAGSSSSHSNSCKPRPKAPLMQKALQLIKYNRFKR